jgi:hypothetical protein
MAHGYGLSAKLRMVPLLYGSIKGIHVDMYDFPFVHDGAKIIILR